MPIIVDIDVMLAKRKMPVGVLAEKVGITPANLAVLKNGRAKAVRFTTLEALCEVLSSVPNRSGRPVAVVAHTVKGKGVSFMEDDNNWHYRAPTAAEVEAARKELGLA